MVPSLGLAPPAATSDRVVPLRVDLELTTAATARPVLNLWPLYLQDLAAYERRVPNPHGLLVDAPELDSWEAVGATQAAWWAHPRHLFPYLIRADGAPAGFALVAGGEWVPRPGFEWTVYEFFVVHAFRGTRAAATAARAAIARHHGRWEVCTWPTAARALRFWRRVLPSCTTAGVDEHELDHPFGRRVVFTFET